MRGAPDPQKGKKMLRSISFLYTYIFIIPSVFGTDQRIANSYDVFIILGCFGVGQQTIRDVPQLYGW